MIYTLERFEENLAVLLDDDKKIISIDKALLGDNAEIGNVFESDNKVNFVFLKNETEKRRSKAVSLHRSLFGKNKK